MDNTARKPRVGDMVTLKPMKVIAVHNGGANIVMSVEGIAARAQVSLPHIAAIDPRPLQAGDRVLWVSSGRGSTFATFTEGNITATDGKFAWVHSPAIFGPQTVKLSDLTRVEDKP